MGRPTTATAIRFRPTSSATASITPDGYRYLESFRLEGTLPVWTFAVADALVERRVWMAYGANTTYVTYRLLRGSRPLDLEVTPLVTYRSFHALASGQGWTIGVEPRERGRDDPRLRRGDAVSAALGPGRVPARRRLVVGFPPPSGDRARTRRSRRPLRPGHVRGAPRTRRDGRAGLLDRDRSPNSTPPHRWPRPRHASETLLDTAGAEDADPVVQQLVLAADQFLVARPLPDDPGRASRSSPATTGSTTGAATR